MPPLVRETQATWSQKTPRANLLNNPLIFKIRSLSFGEGTWLAWVSIWQLFIWGFYIKRQKQIKGVTWILYSRVKRFQHSIKTVCQVLPSPPAEETSHTLAITLTWCRVRAFGADGFGIGIRKEMQKLNLKVPEPIQPWVLIMEVEFLFCGHQLLGILKWLSPHKCNPVVLLSECVWGGWKPDCNRPVAQDVWFSMSQVRPESWHLWRCW